MDSRPTTETEAGAETITEAGAATTMPAHIKPEGRGGNATCRVTSNG